ncbi:MAG: DUF1614 domain-containing protein [Candidatus Thermoplasmatota archaeon]|nr:DUF1614 domain-containing protein [Candidatus Thermoplasmatota archaeon]
MNISTLIYILSIIILPVLILFAVYRFSVFVFESISIDYKTATLITFFILLSTFVPSFLFPQTDHILVCSISSWNLGIHPIGFILPVLISLLLLSKKRLHCTFILLSLIPVSLMAYIVTTPVLEKGIISPFPLWLFPPLMAAFITVLNYEKLGKHISLYAFILGVFGIIIGADLSHLPSLLQFTTSSMQATFGGAGSVDLIFLSGMFSVVFAELFLFLVKTLNQAKLTDSWQMHM